MYHNDIENIHWVKIFHRKYSPLEENNNIKDRILLFIKHLGISINEFAEKTGFGQGGISKISEEKPAFGVNKLVNIFTIYPQLNKDWLLFGEGEMIKGKVVAAEQKGIPYYDIAAAAGPIEMYDDLQEHVVDYLRFPGADFNDCDFCVKVWGDSMIGVCNPGDIIICKEVKDRSLINPRSVYFIITSEYKTIKYVHPGTQEGHIMLRSSNELIEDFEVPMNKVQKIYHVRGTASIRRIAD